MSPTVRASAPSASQMPETVWRITAMLSGIAGTTSATSAVSARHDVVAWPLSPACASAREAKIGKTSCRSGQLEDAADGGVGVVAQHEAERRVALARPPQAADQDAEDGRVDERRLIHVDDDGIGLAQLVQARAQLGRGGEVVLSGHDEHGPLAIDGDGLDATAARQRPAPSIGVSCGLPRISHQTYIHVGRSSNHPHVGPGRRTCGAAPAAPLRIRLAIP